jgi:cell division protein ZapA (FtsZ GTPase activity inhibitor)
VSSTDGDTERTALSIANTDIKVWKSGATTLASKNSGGATHIANGEYYCVLDATDTDTIGPLKLTIHVATALYVQVFCVVLDEAVYDVLFGTTALSTLGGTAQTGDAFARLGAPAGASVSADIAAVAAYVDTEVGAIKTQTDKMVFTVANQLDVNVIDWKGATAPAMTGDAFARLGAPAGASVSADIAAVATYVDTEVAAIKAKTDNLPIDPADASDIAASFSTVNSTLSTIAGYIDTEVAAIKAKTDNLPADPADESNILAAIAALNNLSAAQVNAEVVDALATDTYAEPGQGAPAATTTIAAKINYLYKLMRNKKEQTATAFKLYDDAGTTVDQKSTVSDDTVTATRGELVSGP